MSDKISSFLADRVFLQILNMSITAGIIILVVEDWSAGLL